MRPISLISRKNPIPTILQSGAHHCRPGHNEATTKLDDTGIHIDEHTLYDAHVRKRFCCCRYCSWNSSGRGGGIWLGIYLNLRCRFLDRLVHTGEFVLDQIAQVLRAVGLLTQVPDHFGHRLQLRLQIGDLLRHVGRLARLLQRLEKPGDGSAQLLDLLGYACRMWRIGICWKRLNYKDMNCKYILSLIKLILTQKKITKNKVCMH